MKIKNKTEMDIIALDIWITKMNQVMKQLNIGLSSLKFYKKNQIDDHVAEINVHNMELQTYLLIENADKALKEIKKIKSSL